MKKQAIGYDYGECEMCNTHIQEKFVKQDFWIRGELVIVEDVPAGVCPQCGEKVVNAEVGRWVMELIGNSGKIAKAPKVSFLIIKFEKASVT